MRPVGKLLHAIWIAKKPIEIANGDCRLWQILHPHPVCIRTSSIGRYCRSQTAALKSLHRIQYSPDSANPSSSYRDPENKTAKSSAPKPVHKARPIIRAKPTHSKKNIWQGNSHCEPRHSPVPLHAAKSAKTAPEVGSGLNATASQWPPEIASAWERTCFGCDPTCVAG
jgi:hypothetical protein